MADKWYLRQVGPLPLGLWLAAGAAGIGLAVYGNRFGKAEPVAATTTDAQLPDGAYGSTPAGVDLGAILTLPGGVAAGQTGTSSGSVTAPTSNGEWVTRATRDLVARNYDPLLVDVALRKYVEGRTLTAADQAVVALALQTLGPPPSPAPVAPDPTPVTPSPAAGPVPIYPNWAAGAPGTCPAGTRLIHHAEGNRWTCATPKDYADFANLVEYIRVHGRPPF